MTSSVRISVLILLLMRFGRALPSAAVSGATDAALSVPNSVTEVLS